MHVGENPTGHSITAAPLVVDDKVIVGISGGEAGIRGFLDAYDAKTGKQAWRFWTVPSPGEPGSESWPGDSWVHGGGATWLTGSYDPALKLLYWGTGNPGPDWNGDSRKGDNLYTSSLVAIDVDTGKPRWHFQFTPHDVHDWDANQIPVLVDTQVGGRARALVVTANRNGFYYALDRKTGEFVFGTPYAKQTWAKGLDEHGRPIEIPGMEPSEKGTLVYPSLQGSTNWASPSYSPLTDMLYVPVREMGSIYYKTGVEYKPGTYYTGGSEKRLDEESWGAVRALDVKTGKQAWDFKLPTPTWAGVMATAGGLVFSGSNEGNFYALDAKTGKPLWQFQTGGAIRSGPMSYLGRRQAVRRRSPAVTRSSSLVSSKPRTNALPTSAPAVPAVVPIRISKIGMPQSASPRPPLPSIARQRLRVVPDARNTSVRARLAIPPNDCGGKGRPARRCRTRCDRHACQPPRDHERREQGRGS